MKFAGRVSAGGISGRIAYEGYTQNAPFGGVIATPELQLGISVLDNTSGQMIICDGMPSLGPPETIGRFVCTWK